MLRCSRRAGQDLHGYRRKEITQFQTTLTHFFDQVMGASRLTLVGEVGVTHVGGLESTSDVRYGRDPVYGPGAIAATGASNLWRSTPAPSTVPARALRPTTAAATAKRRLHHVDFVGLPRSRHLGIQRRIRRCEPQAERGLVP